MAWLAALAVSARAAQLTARQASGCAATYEMAALGPRITMRWDGAPSAIPGGVPNGSIQQRRRSPRGALRRNGDGAGAGLRHIVARGLRGRGLGPAEESAGAGETAPANWCSTSR